MARTSEHVLVLLTRKQVAQAVRLWGRGGTTQCRCSMRGCGACGGGGIVADGSLTTLQTRAPIVLHVAGPRTPLYRPAPPWSYRSLVHGRLGRSSA